jgi:hypothetical protein
VCGHAMFILVFLRECDALLWELVPCSCHASCPCRCLPFLRYFVP